MSHLQMERKITASTLPSIAEITVLDVTSIAGVPAKKDVIRDIINNYSHNVEAEGYSITKRRLWYILKPQFASADLTGIIARNTGLPVQPITNKDFNSNFNDLAKEGSIDDSYIYDSSRTTHIGERLPHIVIVAEKATIEKTVQYLAKKFGVSCYISGGYSSIYAVRKLMQEIEDRFLSYIDTDGNIPKIVLLAMTDHDKAGYEIEETVVRHFRDCVSHRVLIDPSQVPADRVEAYFNESAKLGRHYELDVLNIHELVDVFMANVPVYIKKQIVGSHDINKREEIGRYEIDGAVEEDGKLQDLLKRYHSRRAELEKVYRSRFVKADPITIFPHGLEEIYEDGVNYEVADWKVT